jgi:hypothetical protein
MILAVHSSNIHMRFVIITSSISALLVAAVSAICITLLSWIHPDLQNFDAASDIKTEIFQGQEN